MRPLPTSLYSFKGSQLSEDNMVCRIVTFSWLRLPASTLAESRQTQTRFPNDYDVGNSEVHLHADDACDYLQHPSVSYLSQDVGCT